MSTPLSPATVIEALGLKPHPTCGHATVTHQVFASELGLASPRSDDQAVASVLYFLVTPDAQMRLHRIPTTQMYHHYAGDALEVLMLHPDGTGETTVIGSDLRSGMRPQLVVPGGTFHVSRLAAGHSFALCGTTEWGALGANDLELGDPVALARDYPEHTDWLGSLVPHSQKH